MGTQYDYIFTEFKDKITDPELILFSKDMENEMLVALMSKAIRRCYRICNKPDLNLRSDIILEFKFELPYDVIDIITEWMIVFWLEPFKNNLENLKNALSTKDFTVFSPANLLEKIGNEYENSRKRARSLMNEYSYRIADMSRLKS